MTTDTHACHICGYHPGSAACSAGHNGSGRDHALEAARKLIPLLCGMAIFQGDERDNAEVSRLMRIVFP
jgi:hypothetical protein